MDNISDIQSRFRLTKKILQCISSHLSGREDCKGVTYIVEITENSISCKQPIYVYPDRYHRKDIDKEHIIHHIIEHHFPELAVSKQSCTYYIPEGVLFPATYFYTKLNGRRHWGNISVDLSENEDITAIISYKGGKVIDITQTNINHN